MKILALSKRQYTNKDLLDDRYGRVWELPYEIAKNGHQVEGICLSYRQKKTNSCNIQHSAYSFINWQSFNLIGGLFRYLLYTHNIITRFRPNIIWTTSDAIHIIWGVTLGKIYKIPVICDLYDNYEFFKLSSVYGIKPLYRFMLRKSDGISYVSDSLSEWVSNSCDYNGITSVIGNGIDEHIFFPMPQKKCREYFKLPVNVALIGTAGALQENRDINLLYQAFELLAYKNTHLHLALAGIGPRNHNIFSHPNVHDLGILDYHDIPFFINMLDVAVVCNKNSEFGRFCFPQKAYEILACDTSIVSANIGVMSDLLQNHPESLFFTGQCQDLSKKINIQLTNSSKITIPIQTWSTQATRLEALISSIVS